jgi:hypothetical protein
MAFALIKFSTVMKLGFSGRKCPGEHTLSRKKRKYQATAYEG